VYATERLATEKKRLVELEEKCVLSCRQGVRGDRCRDLQSKLTQCEEGVQGLKCRLRYQHKLRKLRSKSRYADSQGVKKSKKALKENPERNVPNVTTSFVEMAGQFQKVAEDAEAETEVEQEDHVNAAVAAENEVEVYASEPQAQSEADAEDETPLIMLDAVSTTNEGEAEAEADAQNVNQEVQKSTYFQELVELTSSATSDLESLSSAVDSMEQHIDY